MSDVSAATIQRILAETKPGITQDQVAAAAGVSRKTVYVAWKAAGVKHDRIPFRRPPLVSDQRVVALSLQGLSVAEIARLTGFHRRTIERARARAGIAGPTPTSMGSEEIARAEQMLADGASYREVARTIGVCWTTVRRHFPGRGWTPQQAAEYRTALRLYGQVVA